MKVNIRNIGRSARRKLVRVFPVLKGKGPNVQLSPVPHLLLSNVPPNDTEISVITTLIEDTKQKLAVLERGPSKSQSSHQHKQAYRELIRIHEPLLSPVRRLPVEILIEIFTQASYSELKVHSTPPWDLSQVCSEWRRIALDVPLLWNCVRVQLDEVHKTHAYLQFLSMLLYRSRQAPLDLSVSAMRSGFEYIQHPVIGFLLEHAERWRFLHLEMSSRTFQAFKSIKGRLQRLRTVELNIYKPFVEEVMDTFEDAPQLRTFINHAVAPHGFITMLPWTQLTSFQDDLDNVATRDIMLEHATTLESLHFTFKRHFQALPSLPATRLEKLTSFTIEFPPVCHSPHPIAVGFLDDVTLPAVENVSFLNFHGQVDSVLKSLIVRSHASLKKLELSRIPLELEQGVLTSILHLTPQLTDLTTTIPTCEELASLIITDTQPTLVPLLQNLTLHAPTNYIVQGFEHIMAQLVASRCRAADAAHDPPHNIQDLASRSSPPTDIRIRLVFYDLEHCLSTQEFLESVYRDSKRSLSAGAPVAQPPVKRTLAELGGLAIWNNMSRISDYITWADDPTISRKSFKGNNFVTAATSNRLLQALKKINECEISDVSELYSTRVHHLLYHISQAIEEADLAQHPVLQSWEQSINPILDKWNRKFFIPDLPNRRWAFQGFQSLVYTPLTADIRAIPELALKMIYGAQFFSDKYSDKHGPPWVPLFTSNLRYID